MFQCNINDFGVNCICPVVLLQLDRCNIENEDVFFLRNVSQDRSEVFWY